MPSRQVRKLLQEEVRKQGAEESESENEDTERVAQPFPFSLLSEDEAEQVDEQEDEEQEPTPAPRHVLPADAKASSTRKGKKKGGKKGKGGGGKEDEIDILLKELSVADGAKVRLCMHMIMAVQSKRAWHGARVCFVCMWVSCHYQPAERPKTVHAEALLILNIPCPLSVNLESALDASQAIPRGALWLPSFPFVCCGH
eukprot:1159400-Pelagomonas_calceolata.AAC.4